MSPRFLLVAILGLLFAAVGLWLDGGREWTAIREVMSELQRSNQTPALHCADSFYWLCYAREMVDTGKIRIRHSQMDNAPCGRPFVSWASLNIWYLVALGEIGSKALGVPVRDALLPASLWANPILYFSLLAGVLAVGWKARCFPAAALSVLILGSSPRLFGDFGFAAPGHHSWHDIATFSTVAFLGIGIRKMDRRLFFLAGLAGACAVWIGATQQGFILASLGVGALAGMFLTGLESRSSPAATNPAESIANSSISCPECWRIFGISGALFSIVLYWVEFGFQPVRMQLEVIHPLYSAGFLLGGEFLFRCHRLILLKRETRSPSDVPVLIVTSLALMTIAGLLLLGPPEWHAMRQPLIQRLHNKISEFQPITAHYGLQTAAFLAAPILLCLFSSTHLFRRRFMGTDKMALVTCTVPCAVSIGMCLLQLRWTGSAGTTTAALIAVLFSHIRHDSTAREEFPDHAGRKAIPAVYIIVPILCMALWCFLNAEENTGNVKGWAEEQLADAEVAKILHDDAAALQRPPIAVFSSQKERQAWIGYATGIPAIGSLYWDNPDGIRDEVEFFASLDDETAHQIALARGITHVVTTTQPGPVITYTYIRTGIFNPPEIRKTLAFRLASPKPTPPAWLQPLPTRTPAMLALGLRIYRVLR